jgi:tetratricopeptide (TPR) repeat protein
MDRLVELGAGTPDVEQGLWQMHATTQAYYGRIRGARELMQRVVVSASANDEKEVVEDSAIFIASIDANVGFNERASREVLAVLKDATAPELRIQAATVLALAGDSARAQTITDEIIEQFPLHTEMGYIAATNRAVIELNRNNPSKAIEVLRTISPYEFNQERALFAVYVRGLANLRQHLGKEATADFQELLDHPGIVLNNVQGALAHLSLARAYVLQGDTAKARAAYQDFLTLWKDADPDIPVLIAAKSEYAKLK